MHPLNPNEPRARPATRSRAARPGRLLCALWLVATAACGPRSAGSAEPPPAQDPGAASPTTEPEGALRPQDGAPPAQQASAPPAPPVDEPGDPALPGVTEVSGTLSARLVAALAPKPAGYVPRTHHKGPDGAPTFINRLIFETSPYLLQHAHNPVNWYPWGPEAFARARHEGKPVLSSVGYATGATGAT